MARKKVVNKVREFWKYGINPITGWKPITIINNEHGVPTQNENTADQASIFKPLI